MKGRCVKRGGCLGNTPFFLAVRKRRPRHRRLVRGWCGWDASTFDAFVPLLMGGIPCRLFFASARPNHGRCPRPVPTILPLPCTRHLDESELVVNEGHGPLEVRSPGAFLCSPLPPLKNLLPGFRRTKCWLCSDVLIDVAQKMNHFSCLLILQSFFGKSQQLILSGFDGGFPPFGFGIGHTEGP